MARIRKEMKGGSQIKARAGSGKKKKEIDPTALEAQKLKMQELRRQKEERMRALLREKLAVEEKISRINRLKIQDHWRQVMRQVKVEDLRNEIELLSQNHEREVDRKEAIIQMLDRDLDEADEQYEMALRSHLQNVDTLIELQKSRLRVMKELADDEISQIQQEFSAEKEVIAQRHAQERQELTDIMNTMEAEFAEKEDGARQEFQSQKEDIKNKTSEEYNVLRIMLESQIDALGAHFEQAHSQYMLQTEQRTQAFKLLTMNDHKNAKTIEMQLRKLQRKQEELAHWKTKMYNNMRECEERNKALKEEKDAIAKHFHDLKARMNAFRAGQAKRLAELTKNARGATGKLKERVKKAEAILKLSELNKKMESERERVLPFYKSTVTTEEAEGEDAGESPELTTLHSAAVDAEGRTLEEWDKLQNFFKRYNKVLLDKHAISKEKERLIRENQDLRLILKQYLDGISVNDDVMNAANPLLVVNGRTNQVRRMPVAPMTQAVIEGNKEYNALVKQA
eukprot:TRINITY_DN1680_c0_g1_i2.p1 TRINITY_DN1680_c0_g1~~TRINITY_DN1680_c0_g1_i2.p1  ORF type:complete len:511 (-),score=160.32 TRINITY_DN1680_c0_g1_i2:175-1707(-)